MKLTLTRPFAVFDLETTGTNVTLDRIVEIAIIKINPDGSEDQYYRRINPTIPIPAESSTFHHIFDADVANEPTFAQAADEIAAFIGDADLAGYNSNKFDIPVLAEEFLRIDHPFDISSRRFVDVQNIFHKMEQRTLAAAYQFYCSGQMENAHNALYDTRVTLEVFKAQLERYQDLSDKVEELADFSRQGNMEWHDFAGRLSFDGEGKICYNFGKHRGRTVEDIFNAEPGYYGWMMDADFPLYTKLLLRKEVERLKDARRQLNQAQNQAQGQNRSENPNNGQRQNQNQQRNQHKPVSQESMEDKLAALKNKFSK
jgi:DNA polymerase III subunit epsilon